MSRRTNLMDKRRSRFAPGASFAEEALESRMVLSGVGSHVALHLQRGAAEIAAQVLRKAWTSTSLAVSTGTLGQPITFNVMVRARSGRVRRSMPRGGDASVRRPRASAALLSLTFPEPPAMTVSPPASVPGARRMSWLLDSLRSRTDREPLLR
jgi:hypothetical protein